MTLVASFAVVSHFEGDSVIGVASMGCNSSTLVTTPDAATDVISSGSSALAVAVAVPEDLPANLPKHLGKSPKFAVENPRTGGGFFQCGCRRRKHSARRGRSLYRQLLRWVEIIFPPPHPRTTRQETAVTKLVTVLPPCFVGTVTDAAGA